jgi:NAD-dependent dihydropyrimidine dehydrogenase PreA subunit
MTYVIAEPCIDVKDRACVDVCPVERATGDRGVRQRL